MKTYNVYFTRSHVRSYEFYVMLGVRANNQKEACRHVLVTMNPARGVGFYPFDRCAVEYPMTDRAKEKLDAWCRRYGIKYRLFNGVNADGKRIGHVHDVLYSTQEGNHGE